MQGKRALDSDPAGRQRSGVRRYRVSQAVDDPNYVMIDLEFDTRDQAEGLLRTMQGICGRPDHDLTRSQQARIVDVVESLEFRGTPEPSHAGAPRSLTVEETVAYRRSVLRDH